MASRSPDDLDPKLQLMYKEFISKCDAAGLRIVIDCTYRSSAEQAQLYAQGRTAPGPIVTHAQPGQSAHNFTKNGQPCARAFDIAIYLNATGQQLDWNASDSNWQLVHAIGRSIGFELGADWPAPLTDGPHFELPNWKWAP